MGRLAEEMVRLKTEVNQLRENRRSFARRLKEDRARLVSTVSDLTGKFSAERKERHEQVRKGLSEFRAGLSGFVSELELEVSRMTERFHREMDDIRQAREDRNAGVDDIRESVAGFIESSRRKRLETADRLRQELTAFRHQILDRVRETAAKGKPERFAAVAGIRQEVDEMMDTFRRNLDETARQGRESRAAYTSGIRESVAGMMREMSDFRSGLINELNAMRRVWQDGEVPDSPASEAEPDFADDLRDRAETAPVRAPEFDPGPVAAPDVDPLVVEENPGAVPEPKTEPQPAADPSISVDEPVSADKGNKDADDLSLISGIGPERHKQLNTAGIRTFADLASADPDQLYEILNRQAGRASIILWIDQAKELNF